MGNHNILKKISWIMYDFANSAFVLVVSAIAFPVFFREVALGGGVEADKYWGAIVAASYLVSGLIAPFIGALADRFRCRKLILIVTTLAASLSTIAIGFTSPDNTAQLTILYVVGQISWVLAVFIYDAFLSDVVVEDKSYLMSGTGWGLGYLGGLACLAITYPMLKNGFSSEHIDSYMKAFTVTGLFYLFFALPALFVLKNPIKSNSEHVVSISIRDVYGRVFETIKSWNKYKVIFLFLFGLYFVSDGITTVIYFMSSFLRETFSYSISEILIWTVIVQVVGIPATVLFGWLSDKWNPTKTLTITIFIWIVAMGIAGLFFSPSVPTIIAVLIGLVIGSTQSISRAMYSKMIPDDKRNEFFGFNAFTGRVATLFGPLLFGFISSYSGNQQIAMGSLVLFFFVGIVLIIYSARKSNV